MNHGSCFAVRIVACACVEGIMGSHSFCTTFWPKKCGKLPGLSFSNELIAKDVELHTVSCKICGMLQNRLPKVVVHDIVRGAIKAERRFIYEALLCDLIGINIELMTKYIEFLAARLLSVLGHVDPVGWPDAQR